MDSAAALLGACLESLTLHSHWGQEWFSCLLLSRGSAGGRAGADWGGNEGAQTLGAEPLSKLTCGGETPWIGAGRTRLTSLVAGTQHLCGGPKRTTPFLDSVKNGLPWIGGRGGGGLPLEKQRHPLSKTIHLCLSWSDTSD